MNMTPLQKLKRYGCGFAAGLAAIHPASSLAEGFRVSPPGAFSLGRAGGKIAHVDDASAVGQNPANLVDLQNAEAQVGSNGIYVDMNHVSPGGVKTENRDSWNFMPTIFAAFPIKENRFAAGIGMSVPFGLSSSWDSTPATPFHFAVPNKTEMKTINLNPSVAYRLNDWLSVGAGLDVMWSELTLEQHYPWMVFPGSTGAEPQGTAKIKGDGTGVGANLGMTIQLAEHHRLAFSYRSQMDVGYSGKFTVDGITPAAAAFGATPSSKMTTEVQFPNILAVGYGVQLCDTVRIEADFEWVQFSRFQSLDLNIANNAFLLPTTSIQEKWNNSFTAGIGGDWRFSENWTARAGYMFYDSPIRDFYFSPAIPDSDQHVITVGLSYQSKHHGFEVAYGYDFFDDRNITANQNPAFLGKYEIGMHLFALAYRYRF